METKTIDYTYVMTQGGISLSGSYPADRSLNYRSEIWLRNKCKVVKRIISEKRYEKGSIGYYN